MKTKGPETPDDYKFRQLVLFICRRSDGDRRFGAVKLNKLLFFSDFIAYQKFGSAITSHKYQKLKEGPAPRAMLPILQQMKEKGLVASAERDYFGRTQKLTVALKEPDVSCFTVEEIALVTALIAEFWNKDARQMSELSHRFRGWELAKPGVTIPYEVATVKLVRPESGDLHLTEEEKSELRSLVSEGH